jgi:glycosyltransferase involved in cell wall biosynthesis
MKILFLTMVKIDTLDNRGIYTDLLRKFRDEGHDVYVISPSERRYNNPTNLVETSGCNILNVKTFNLQKTNIIEKGIGILALEYQYLYAIKTKLNNVKFDLILYSTPPITFSKVISYLKNRDNAFSYLLLKDIFPQNAVDLSMMKKDGIIHKYFRKKEIELYSISDKIGCMSPANVDYIVKHNPEFNNKLEVNPNSIEIAEVEPIDILAIRKKYGIPFNKVVFVYGGNLGKPQGIDFLKSIIETSKNEIPNAYFLIIGNGTEYNQIFNWFEKNKPQNAKLIDFLPKNEYDNLVKSSDVGMILLSPKFTIPNFPSRLLTYLEFSLPVFSATDPNTDLTEIIENNNLGYGVMSGDVNYALEKIRILSENKILRNQMGKNANKFMHENYDVSFCFNKILNSINE